MVQESDVVEMTAHQMRRMLGMHEDGKEAIFAFEGYANYVDDWNKWKPKRWTITVPKGDTLDVTVTGIGGCAFILTGEGDGNLLVKMEQRSIAIRAGSGKGNATVNGPGDALRTEEGPGEARLVNGDSKSGAITGIDAGAVDRGPYGEWTEPKSEAPAAEAGM